jgi:type I restriction enzyme M protein
MKRIQKEMQEVIAEEVKSQEMLVNAFKGIGYGIK